MIIALLSTIAIVGSLVMMALPVNFVHRACGTELRRRYVQDRINPALKLFVADSFMSVSEPLLSFEGYDRVKHLGSFNTLIGFRAVFVGLPAAILAAVYLLLRLPTLAELNPGVLLAESAVIVVGAAMIVSSVRSYFRMLCLVKHGT